LLCAPQTVRTLASAAFTVAGSVVVTNPNAIPLQIFSVTVFAGATVSSCPAAQQTTHGLGGQPSSRWLPAWLDRSAAPVTSG
jgi:hypothetical protein